MHNTHSLDHVPMVIPRGWIVFALAIGSWGVLALSFQAFVFLSAAIFG